MNITRCLIAILLTIQCWHTLPLGSTQVHNMVKQAETNQKLSMKQIEQYEKQLRAGGHTAAADRVKAVISKRNRAPQQADLKTTQATTRSIQESPEAIIPTPAPTLSQELQDMQGQLDYLNGLNTTYSRVPLIDKYNRILLALDRINILRALNDFKAMRANESVDIDALIQEKNVILAMRDALIEYFNALNITHGIKNGADALREQKQQGTQSVFTIQPGSILGSWFNKPNAQTTYEKIKKAIECTPGTPAYDALYEKVETAELERRIDGEMKPMKDKELTTNVSWMPRGKYTWKKIQILNKRINDTTNPPSEKLKKSLEKERMWYARKGLSGYDNNEKANNNQKDTAILNGLTAEQFEAKINGLLDELRKYSQHGFFGYRVEPNDTRQASGSPASFEDAIIKQAVANPDTQAIIQLTKAMNTFENMIQQDIEAARQATLEAEQKERALEHAKQQQESTAAIAALEDTYEEAIARVKEANDRVALDAAKEAVVVPFFLTADLNKPGFLSKPSAYEGPQLPDLITQAASSISGTMTVANKAELAADIYGGKGIGDTLKDWWNGVTTAPQAPAPNATDSSDSAYDWQDDYGQKYDREINDEWESHFSGGYNVPSTEPESETVTGNLFGED